MLKTIDIKSLFGEFSYTLDMKPEMECYHFITGPNGYGKTTVLKILKALYHCDMDTLANIPYDVLSLLFEDGNVVKVVQKRDFADDIDTDEQILKNVNLHVEFGKHVFEWNSNDPVDLGLSDMSLYFQSHPVYHISDGRIFTPSGEPAVMNCAKEMRNLLRYDSNYTPDFTVRMEVFKNIIARSEFVHKQMELSPVFGIRFKADNEDRTILPVDKLSSGEQHILIQTFELLFNAPDESLVLVDEPEISFHMVWQVDYLKNIREITSMRNLQCIICTHSPQIFNQDWSLTDDLYDKAK